MTCSLSFVVVKLSDFICSNEDLWTSFMNNDVASTSIENSLLDVFMLGEEAVRGFMCDRLVTVEIGDKPEVAFISRLPKINARTFANLFDVEKQTNMTEKQVVSVHRKILQRFVLLIKQEET